MWFKNLLVYRLHNWPTTTEKLEEQLASLSLQPIAGLELNTKGWVSPKADNGSCLHELAGHLLLCFASEKKLLPSSVINQVVKQRAQEIQERDGFKPGRKRLKELKEEITDELLPRAFSVQTKTLIWIDPSNRTLVMDAASLSKADDIVALLVRTIPGLSLSLVRTRLSPAVAMTTWLEEDACPPSFTVDRDCELKGRSEEASAVRYVKHALDSDEIRAHIKAGKEVTRLAMTWADKISFVLHETMQIKRISPLDVVKEQAGFNDNEDTFDADFGLMTAELSRLIPSILESLGGEMEQAQAA